jgi:hypothetical protein
MRCSTRWRESRAFITAPKFGETETGRLTYLPRGGEERLKTAREVGTFRELAALAKLRRSTPALIRGAMKALWIDSGEAKTDDGIFAFARYVEGKDGTVDTAQTVVVVFNASRQTSTTGLPGNPMRLANKAGTSLWPAKPELVVLGRVPAAFDDAVKFTIGKQKELPTAEITVPGRSVVILGVKP